MKAALAHVQFETIHPFLDGNGRLGRLLITLLLCSEQVLHTPMLYLSLYFKTHRQRYYGLLDEVRRAGDWEAWLAFFAEAVRVTAEGAVATVQRLLRQAADDRARISSLGRVAGSELRIHRALRERPIAAARWLVEQTELTSTTVNTCLLQLQQLGIIIELTGHKRNRLFSYQAYLRIMNEGTETPAE